MREILGTGSEKRMTRGPFLSHCTGHPSELLESALFASNWYSFAPDAPHPVNHFCRLLFSSQVTSDELSRLWKKYSLLNLKKGSLSVHPYCLKKIIFVFFERIFSGNYTKRVKVFIPWISLGLNSIKCRFDCVPNETFFWVKSSDTCPFSNNFHSLPE